MIKPRKYQDNDQTEYLIRIMMLFLYRVVPVTLGDTKNKYLIVCVSGSKTVRNREQLSA
jgi:hypothetical protein